MGRVLPVLFNTDMVQAILDGRKGATRRVVMPHNRKKAKEQGYCQGNGLWVDPSTDNGDKEGHIKDYSLSPCWMSYQWYINRYAPCQPGDILYVRETWCTGYDGEAYFYRADRNTERASKLIDYDDRRWRPSIHMPKAAARIWLKVTDVRVERLQEIRDFRAEGIRLSEGCEECLAVCGECNRDETPIGCDNEIKLFADLWDSTLSRQDKGRYGWEANPWVWVIELERCGKPETR